MNPQIYSLSVRGQILAVGIGSVVELRQVSSPTASGVLLKGHTGAMNCVLILPDGSVVTTASDWAVRRWACDGRELWMTEMLGGEAHALAALDGGRQVVVGCTDRKVHILDGETGAPVAKAEGHAHWVCAVAPLGHGFISASTDQTMRAWSGKTHHLSSKVVQGVTREIRSLAVSPCGSVVAAGCEDGAVDLYGVDPSTLWAGLGWKRQAVFKHHSAGIRAAAFSPNGLVLATGAADGTTAVVSAETGRVLASVTGHTDCVTSLAFSPLGNALFTGCLGGVLVSTPLARQHDRAVRALTYAVLDSILPPQDFDSLELFTRQILPRAQRIGLGEIR